VEAHHIRDGPSTSKGAGVGEGGVGEVKQVLNQQAVLLRMTYQRVEKK
jgi:hypothetical protein